jgi:chemotaxis protein methyltransferase CheR
VVNQSITYDEYQEFREFLESASGIALGDNKQYLVNSRLGGLVTEMGLSSVGELVGRVKSDTKSGLRERIVDAMTTNETLWFRDHFPFEILKSHILPELSALRARPARIWSAACSSGQEPYSMSMIIQEYLQTKPGSLPRDVQITATDISSSVLKDAKEGLYDAMALARGLSEERKKRFFDNKGKGWQVKPEIRKRITFSEMNLMKKDYLALGKFDVIFCRNVLIYFSSEVKREILKRFSQVLEPGGYICLGASESMSGYVDFFETVRYQGGLVYRLKKAG